MGVTGHGDGDVEPSLALHLTQLLNLDTLLSVPCSLTYKALAITLPAPTLMGEVAGDACLRRHIEGSPFLSLFL